MLILALGMAFRDYRNLRRLHAEKADLPIDGWLHSHTDEDGEWEKAYQQQIGAAKTSMGRYLILAMLPLVVWYVLPPVLSWFGALK